jgi:TNF receptor-associated factor 4
MFVTCPRKCQAGETIPRKYLEEHLKEDCPHRDYTCEYCSEMGTFNSITQVHMEVCGKWPVRCSNSKCTQTVQRDMIEHHVLEECGYTVVSCKYQDIGCDLKFKRHDMAEHVGGDDKTHLHMALNAVVALKKRVAELEEQTTSALKPGGSMVLKVTEFDQRRLKNKAYSSPPFYTSANGYCMKIQVHPNGCGYGRGTHVSVYTRILQGKNDRELNWPFVGTLKIKLLNQLQDSKHHMKDVKPALQSFDVDTGTIRGCAKFISHLALARDSVKNTEYLKDDTLYFRVSVEVANHKPWLE